eukprot:11273964-Ditylum_brightwellii.AAC.1
MARTIGTNFRLPGWMMQVTQCVKKYQVCQEYKITRQKAYGKAHQEVKKYQHEGPDDDSSRSRNRICQDLVDKKEEVSLCSANF